MSGAAIASLTAASRPATGFVEQQTRPVVQEEPPQRVVGLDGGCFHDLVPVSGSDGGPVSRVADTRRKEDNLRELGLEHGAGMTGGGDQSGFDLRGLMEIAGGVVQRFEASPLVTLGYVRPIGEEQHRRRNQRQRRCSRYVDQQLHTDDGQSRVHGGGEGAERVDLHYVATLQIPAGQADGEIDEDFGGGQSHECRGQRTDPAEETAPVPQGGHEPERGDGQRRLKGELGQVEYQLDGGLSPVDGQHEGVTQDLSDDQFDRVGEEESYDQRQLAHREGMCVPAEAQMNHRQFGEVEGDRQVPPAQLQIGVHRG